jgi:hypothetical protein
MQLERCLAVLPGERGGVPQMTWSRSRPRSAPGCESVDPWRAYPEICFWWYEAPARHRPRTSARVGARKLCPATARVVDVSLLRDAEVGPEQLVWPRDLDVGGSRDGIGSGFPFIRGVPRPRLGRRDAGPSVVRSRRRRGGRSAGRRAGRTSRVAGQYAIASTSRGFDRSSTTAGRDLVGYRTPVARRRSPLFVAGTRSSASRPA